MILVMKIIILLSNDFYNILINSKILSIQFNLRNYSKTHMKIYPVSKFSRYVIFLFVF